MGVTMEDKIKTLEKQISYSNGMNKVDLINELSKGIEVKNPKKALEVSKEALEISQKLNYKRGISWSFLRMAYACRRLSYYEDEMDYLFKALEIFEEIKDKDGEGRALVLLSVNYFYYGRYEEALKYSLKGVKIAKRVGNKVLETAALNNIGEIYMEQKKYEEAIDYYFKSLEIIEELNHKRSTVVILMNIGCVYCELGNYNKGLEQYKRSLITAQEISERIYEADCLNKIGEIYQNKNKDKAALDYYDKSLKIIEREGNKFYSIDILINIGKVFFKIENYGKSLEYFKRALLVSEDIRANKKIYTIHLCLADYYEKIKDFEKALYHYKMYDNIEKEIVTENLEKKLKILTIEFKVEKAKQEAEIYRLKNIELNRKNEEIKRKAEELKKSKEKLEAMEKSRQQLFSNISHDLRTPIASIQGYVEAMQDGLIISEDARKKYLERIHSKVFVLNRLIEDLFQLAKLESRQLTFYFKDVKISDLLQSIYKKYELDVKKYNKKLIMNKLQFDAENIFVSIDTDRIDQVFGNLIFNALKYAKGSDSIEISCERKSSEEIVIKIKDNGEGISKDDLPYIFDRFYKAAKSRELSRGNGLGLSIAQEIVEYHGGSIWVKNNDHKGCTFYFKLPIKTTSHILNEYTIEEKQQN